MKLLNCTLVHTAVGNFMVLVCVCVGVSSIVLLQSRREQELNATPKLKKYWTVIEKRDSKADVEARKRLVIILHVTLYIVSCVSRNQKERHFLFNIILKFFNVLEGIPLTGML